MVTRRKLLLLSLIGFLAPRMKLFAGASSDPVDSEWRHYANDLANTRYAPFGQINADNFGDLEIAWRFKTDAFGPRPDYRFQCTPLMVNGRLFTVAGTRRAVVALDAATGEMLWMHRVDEGERGRNAPRRLSGRGVSYWSDGDDERVLYVTPGYCLIALDARTGDPIPTFGNDGVVDLKENFDQQLDLLTADVGLHATPTIAKDVVIVGAAHSPGDRPKSRANVKGYVRGFDVRTGRRLWIFHTIPRKGQFGYDTWPNGTENIGNGGVWCQVSVDEELNLAYLGVELPTGDEYGGYRAGNALFGECIVAVDLHTGKRRWHFQTVHHGLWDFDIPCAPILMDVPIDGKVVKLLAQASKQNWLYVLNRETGEPIWPIEERPVATGDVPGEWYSPTQPFVTRPAAYDVQGLSPDDLIDFTPDLRADAVKLVSNYRIGPLFTPPSMSTADGTWGTIMVPHLQGGTNWPGGSCDVENNVVYVYSKTEASVLGIVPANAAQSDFSYVRGMVGNVERDGLRPGTLTVRGLPILKPPYGRITAIDLTSGDIVWQIAHGETPDSIRNHPDLKGLDIPRTGRPGLLGPLTTKTLVICGEAGFFTTPDGTRGAMLRAYDKKTGKEVGAVTMPAPQTGAPMTYMQDGRQYIVIAVSGGSYSGELIAFRLPAA